MFAPKGKSSVGVGPSRAALGSVSEGDLRKLMWRTTYTSAAIQGRSCSTGEEKADNFIDIHNMGARDTKFMKFQKKTAPLLDRSALSSSRAFVPLPLDQAALNSKFASNKKHPTASVNPAGQGVDSFKDAKSMYASAHGGFSPQQMRSSRTPSFKPKTGRTSTITNVKDFVELRPRSHVDFFPHNTERLLATGVLVVGPSRGKAAPQGNLGLTGGWGGGPPRTTYQEFTDIETRVASAPATPFGMFDEPEEAVDEEAL